MARAATRHRVDEEQAIPTKFGKLRPAIPVRPHRGLRPGAHQGLGTITAALNSLRHASLKSRNGSRCPAVTLSATSRIVWFGEPYVSMMSRMILSACSTTCADDKMRIPAHDGVETDEPRGVHLAVLESVRVALRRLINEILVQLFAPGDVVRQLLGADWTTSPIWPMRRCETYAESISPRAGVISY